MSQLTPHPNSCCSPILGGQLANPATRYPKLFSATLWKSHPYLLPLLAGATFRTIAVVLVFLYLKEVKHLRFISQLPTRKFADTPLYQ